MSNASVMGLRFLLSQRRCFYPMGTNNNCSEATRRVYSHDLGRLFAFLAAFLPDCVFRRKILLSKLSPRIVFDAFVPILCIVMGWDSPRKFIARGRRLRAALLLEAQETGYAFDAAFNEGVERCLDGWGRMEELSQNYIVRAEFPLSLLPYLWRG